jgi:ABC-type Zn uptake system ZnuABC Zn-binding protein ZnuA
LLVALSMLALVAIDARLARAGQIPPVPGIKVLAVETFLADIARNVAGNRLQVEALLPVGADPHGFQPTPRDVAKVAACDVLIVHGAGIEEFLDEVLRNAGGSRRVIEASAGLQSRSPGQGEKGPAPGGHPHEEAGRKSGHVHEAPSGHHHHEVDPHFWLCPVHAVTFVTNIRDGLSQADPAGAAIYAANADAYIARLRELDQWIAEQVSRIPQRDRLLVTSHESFGYFADRYGFRVVGTVMPGVSTGASPSARELAQLIQKIKETGARAIFLDSGANPRLAEQVAAETQVRVVTELFTHSVTEPGGPAPTYIDMIKFNTTAIVGALQ